MFASIKLYMHVYIDATHMYICVFWYVYMHLCMHTYSVCMYILYMYVSVCVCVYFCGGGIAQTR